MKSVTLSVFSAGQGALCDIEVRCTTFGVQIRPCRHPILFHKTAVLNFTLGQTYMNGRLTNKIPAWKGSRKRAPKRLNRILSAHTMAVPAAIAKCQTKREKLDNTVIKIATGIIFCWASKTSYSPISELEIYSTKHQYLS